MDTSLVATFPSSATSMKSPFQHLLHTNTALTDVQRASILEFLRDSQEELFQLTCLISHLETPADGATRRRAELKAFIDPHLTLLAPINCLPDDIMREIFLHALHGTECLRIRYEALPVILCRVSRYWRNLALTTPRLWASMEIAFQPILEPHSLLKFVGVIDRWIQRSGGVPLDITLDSSALNCDLNLSPIFALLVTISPRWRKIQLPGECSHYFAALTPEDVPLLESFTLGGQVGIAKPLDLLGTSSLRRLVSPYGAQTCEGTISLGGLTNLTLSTLAIFAENVLVLLAQCPHIEVCTLLLIDLTLSSEQKSCDAPLTLSKLRQLSVTYTRVSRWHRTYFFDRIAFPALRSLDLVCENAFIYGTPRQALLPLALVRGLERLCISIARICSTLLHSALADIPNLQELHLKSEPYVHTPRLRMADGTFILPLTLKSAQSGAGVLCPRLRELTMNINSCTGLTEDTLLDLIISRSKKRLRFLKKSPWPTPVAAAAIDNVVPLEKVDCMWMRRTPVKDISRDIETQRRNMEIYLRYLSSDEDGRGVLM